MYCVVSCEFMDKIKIDVPLNNGSGENWLDNSNSNSSYGIDVVGAFHYVSSFHRRIAAAWNRP